MYIDLAITIHGGEIFVKATYYLEGHHLLENIKNYEEISKHDISILNEHYSNVYVVVDKMASRVIAPGIILLIMQNLV